MISFVIYLLSLSYTSPLYSGWAQYESTRLNKIRYNQLCNGYLYLYSVKDKTYRGHIRAIKGKKKGKRNIGQEQRGVGSFVSSNIGEEKFRSSSRKKDFLVTV